MLAHIEAYIDFEADEVSDVTSAAYTNLLKDAEIFKEKIMKFLEEGQISESIREGLKVSIIGPPNAGKSTLMNLLAKRRVSIVSATPGTTRDLVSTTMNLFGQHVVLTDTAGLRTQTSDQIEIEGIEMAQN